MKRGLLTIFFICLSAVIFAQQNFEWDIIDNCAKTKEQLYSDTKIFIANTFNSAQDVIQNDDRDVGIIIVKGIMSAVVNTTFTKYKYDFMCTITFMVKENRFRIKVNNVTCYDGDRYNSAISFEWRDSECIEIIEGYYENERSKQHIQELLIPNLKKNIQEYVNSYIVSMKGSTEEW